MKAALLKSRCFKATTIYKISWSKTPLWLHPFWNEDLQIGQQPITCMVYYSLKSNEVKFCLTIKDYKWVIKCMFINTVSSNGGPLQLRIPISKLGKTSLSLHSILGLLCSRSTSTVCVYNKGVYLKVHSLLVFLEQSLKKCRKEAQESWIAWKNPLRKLVPFMQTFSSFFALIDQKLVLLWRRHCT